MSGASGLDVEAFGDTTTVRVAGELDVASAPRLGEELDRLVAVAPATVVVDLAELTFLGSAGLGVLVQARRDFGACGTRLVLGKVSEPVRRVFRIVHLDGLFEFADDV